MKTNVLLFVVAAVVLFQDRVSLCIPGCPGTSCVVQAGLELIELRHPVSLVLGLKALQSAGTHRAPPACLPSTGFKGVGHYSQL